MFFAASLRVLALLSLGAQTTALATGCASTGASNGAQTAVVPTVADDPGDDPDDFGRPGDPRGFSHSKSIAAIARCVNDEAEKALTRALDDVQGKPQSPALGAYATNAILTCIQSAGMPGGMSSPAAVAMRRLSTPPVMPGSRAAKRAAELAAGAKAHGLDVVLDDRGNLTVVPAPSSLDAQRLQQIAESVATAVRTATVAEQQCSAMALQRGTSLVVQVSTRDVNSGLADPAGYAARERARLKLVLTACSRADGLAAASDALAASLRDSVRSGSGKSIQSATTALAAAMPVAATAATDADVDALMEVADRDARILLEKRREWANDPPESFARQRQRTGAGGAGTGGSAGEPVMSEDAAGDASTLAGAIAGLMHGDIGAVIRGASVLFPKDSPIRHGLAATGALLHGDVMGALSSAAEMVPRDSALGGVLATVKGAVAVERQLHGATGG